MAPCKFLDRDETEEIDKSQSRPGIGDKIIAILAEYNALRSEILNRQDVEIRIIQFHIIALTSIVGFAFFQSLKLWALLLIPIESSLLGLWYLRNEIVITRIGEHIQTSVEPKAWTLLKDKDIMKWETKTARVNGEKSRKNKEVHYKIYELRKVTFGWPSYIILIIYLILYSLIYFGYKQEVYDFYDLYITISFSPTFALIGWAFGAILAYFYWREEQELSKAKNERCNGTN